MTSIPDGVKTYPLSSTQKLLRWTEHFSAERSKARENNIISLYICFSPDESNQIIEKAYNKLIEVNDALRLIFVRQRGKLVQYVSNFEYRKVETEKLSGGRGAFDEYLNHIDRFAIHWKSSRLIWERLVEFDGGKALVVRFHHSVVDGYSISLLLRQFERFYDEYAAGNEPDPGKIYSVTKFFEMEAAYLTSEQHEADVRFWREAFCKQPNYSFPAGRRAQKGDCDAERIFIEGDMYRRLVQLCRQYNCSLAVVCMAVAALTTYALTDKNNFCFYVLTHGRSTPVLRKTVGCMMNTVPIFFNINAGQSVKNFLADTYMYYLEQLQHHRLFINEIMLTTYREAVRNGFNFNHGWMLYSVMDIAKVIAEMKHETMLLPMRNQPHQFYLALLEVPGRNAEISLGYQTRRFKASQVKSYQERFLKVLELCLDDPEEVVGSICKKSAQ